MPGGTHIAFPYATEEERASLLFAYVKAGIDHGEKCIAAVIEYTRDYWLRGLRDAGIAPEPLLGGQLLIFDAADILSGALWPAPSGWRCGAQQPSRPGTAGRPSESAPA